MSRLSVITVSEAFGAFWNDLAVDLGVAVDIVGPAEALARADTVAIIVAAGGAERDAIQWLESHRVPRGLPALGREAALAEIDRCRGWWSAPVYEAFRKAALDNPGRRVLGSSLAA